MMTAPNEKNLVKEILARKEVEQLAQASLSWNAIAMEKAADQIDEIQDATVRDLVIRNVDSIIWP
jgi:hypothetical protein